MVVVVGGRDAGGTSRVRPSISTQWRTTRGGDDFTFCAGLHANCIIHLHRCLHTQHGIQGTLYLEDQLTAIASTAFTESVGWHAARKGWGWPLVPLLFRTQPQTRIQIKGRFIGGEVERRGEIDRSSFTYLAYYMPGLSVRMSGCLSICTVYVCLFACLPYKEVCKNKDPTDSW
ncbi:hypothetical protein BU24DRAFT_111276 [Aaosphaeria arxii CBS 175.79]|uniref:Uncharacterized protein n=1 Tax=Aaosphaeria arxii CBS 175.79 TaxID=1450172 RepID=A0A6A5Y0I2_9PLEO|nr:uncharacterized protein BU24DRAFT_111276 [Aaosphaeria arxii CBS 175.79]KAF2019045.1 hypothetical protein BU24DRAFT_111276 [Aaosphaeria arxii CBS 175.79]